MRSIFRSVAVFGPVFLAACAVASPGEDTASQSSPLVHCSPGYAPDCSGDGPKGQIICTCVPSPNEYSVGGQVAGLTTQGLVLGLYSTQQYQYQTAIYANGPFHWSVPDGPFEVFVVSQPNGQACSIANWKGTVSGQAIADIQVTCGPAYTVGGTVTGLKQQLYLNIDAADEGSGNFSVTQDGPFTSPRTLANGGTYDVSVWSQPQGQQCAVKNGTGTIAGASVGDIDVQCIDLPCGGSGQHACIVGAACTANAAADASDTCECNAGYIGQSGGACVACGASGEPTCAGGSCNGAGLVDVGGTCKPCGASGEPACGGGACNEGLVDVSGSCTPCGKSGQPVCGGGACGSGLVDQNGKCAACGAYGDPACPGNTCDAGLVERGGFCMDPAGSSSGGGSSGGSSSGGVNCADLECVENCGSGCLPMPGTYCSFQDANMMAGGTCQVCCGKQCGASAVCLEGARRSSGR